jgi:GAF domain-containing protein
MCNRLLGEFTPIAEQRSLSEVPAAIIGTVARQPHAALARLWLRQSGLDCPHCSRSSHDSGHSLHLRASAGTPHTAGADWMRTNGRFHRIPLGRSDLKVSHIAASGEPVRIQPLAEHQQWMCDLDWVRAEHLVAFAGHPIVFRGEVLGVLAAFCRVLPQ